MTKPSSKKRKRSRVGQIVNDRYRLDSVLGKGGTSTVYRATQLNLGRDVAFKLLHSRLVDDEDNVQRFIREARITSRLNHRHAIGIYDFGRWGEQLFIVMDILQGPALRGLITKGKPMPIKRVFKLMEQICSVLVRAHEMGLIHRDLKPENIVIEQEEGEDHAVVVDFGLAFINNDEELGRMTTTGVLVGTPQYLSPEQAQGLPITPASDVYSLGVILFELLSSFPPFVSNNVIEMINSHIFMPPPSLRSKYPELKIPTKIDDLVRDMLAKDDASRPTIVDVAAIVSKFLEDPESAHTVERNRSRSDRDIGPRERRIPTLPSRRAIPQPHPRDPNPANVTTQRAQKSAPTIAILGTELTQELATAFGMHALQASVHTVESIPQEIQAIFVENALPELLEQLQTHQKPIITSCPASDFNRIALLMRSGANEVVSHPIRPSELARKITRAIRKHGRKKSKS